jgi:hypothetical protein
MEKLTNRLKPSRNPSPPFLKIMVWQQRGEIEERIELAQAGMPQAADNGLKALRPDH